MKKKKKRTRTNKQKAMISANYFHPPFKNQRNSNQMAGKVLPFTMQQDLQLNISILIKECP